MVGGELMVEAGTPKGEKTTPMVSRDTSGPPR